MKLIERIKLDNGEIAYESDPQGIYEVKEKLYRYERIADEPEKVVAIDKVLEIIDKVIEGQMKQAETFNGNGCHSLVKTHQDQACGAQIAKQAVLRLKEGEQE